MFSSSTISKNSAYIKQPSQTENLEPQSRRSETSFRGRAIFSKKDESPRILFFSNGTVENTIPKICQNKGAVIVNCDYNVEGVDPRLLENEINRILQNSTQEKPIPQLIIEASYLTNALGHPLYPLIKKINDVAQTAVHGCDGVILPPGPSIAPKLYGQSFTDMDDFANRAYCDFSDLRRSVFEFSIVETCFKMHKPLLGIARGHEVINTYFGGSIDRHTLKGYQIMRTRTLKDQPEHPSRFLGELPKTAYFFHRQRTINLGHGLRSVARLEAMQDKDQELITLSADISSQYGRLGPENTVGQKALESETENLLKALHSLEEESSVIALEAESAPIMGVQYLPHVVPARIRTPEQQEASYTPITQLITLAKEHRLERMNQAKTGNCTIM